MSWNTELAYFVTPKSGPMRPMRTLVDVNRALLDDLPFGCRLRPHWAAVARLLLIASDTGATIDVRLATDALVRALETEGWMTRPRPAGTAPIVAPAVVTQAVAAPAAVTPAAVAPPVVTAKATNGQGRPIASPYDRAAWDDDSACGDGSAASDEPRPFGAPPPRRDGPRELPPGPRDIATDDSALIIRKLP